MCGIADIGATSNDEGGVGRKRTSDSVETYRQIVEKAAKMFVVAKAGERMRTNVIEERLLISKAPRSVDC